MLEREETVGVLGLLDDGVDVADFSDGFKNFLVQGLVETAFFFRLLDHLVVVFHQCST